MPDDSMCGRKPHPPPRTDDARRVRQHGEVALQAAGAEHRPRTAFVLSGGGNLAVSQVGMMRALLLRGIVPEVVVGTSAGAINGALVATDPTLASVDRLAELWTALRSGDMFPGNILSRAWNVLSRDDHLFSNEGLRTIIEHVAPAETFEAMAVPMRVVATDLELGEEVVLASGPLAPALLASAAIPGVFAPVEHDGRLLVDGAVTNNMPLSHALAGPVERIYVCNVAGGGAAPTKARSPLDVAVRAFNISRNQRFAWELARLPPGVDVIELPHPDDERAVLDFSGAAPLIEAACALAGAALDAAPAVLASAARPRRRWPWRRSQVA